MKAVELKVVSNLLKTSSNWKEEDKRIIQNKISDLIATEIGIKMDMENLKESIDVLIEEINMISNTTNNIPLDFALTEKASNEFANNIRNSEL